MDASATPIIGDDLNPMRPQEGPVLSDELLAWKPNVCLACGQSLSKPRGAGTKAEVPGKSSLKTPAEAAQNAETQSRPRVGYSNEFLYDSGQVVMKETWPRALDLDRDRDDVSETANVEPIVELVTIVKTSIYRSPYSTSNGHTTAKILSNSKVATSYVGLEVVVNSRRVIEALKRMITYYPNLDLSGTSLKIAEPYAVFFHYRNEIKDYLRTYPGSTGYQSEYQHPDAKRADFKACNEETYKHLGTMQEVIEGQRLEKVEKEIRLHRQTPSIATYRMLWLLFKPGTKVYRSERGRWTAGVVLSVGMDKVIQRKGDALRIKYWNLGFDGFRLGRWEDDCLIKPFEGNRRITELEICPCSFYDANDSGLFRDTLINQGKKILEAYPRISGELQWKAADRQHRMGEYLKNSQFPRAGNDELTACSAWSSHH